MAAALDQAKRGVGLTSPNPPVGAVIVNNGVMVGCGFPRRAGEPHAEIEALNDALQRSPKLIAGSTLYVTLEPCSTTGRTPACTDAIRSARIRRVVYGARDPNPAHQGRADTMLQAARIEVTPGIMEEECREIIRPFAKWITRGLPYVIAKAGQSLDGRLTRPPGEPAWITSEVARAHARRLRGRVDAIIVGAETVRNDNPLLTLREVDAGQGKPQPWRVVMTRTGNLPPNAHLFTDAFKDRTVVMTGLSFPEVLRELGKCGVLSVLVEGGGLILGEAFASREVDEVVWYVAPRLCGSSCRPAIDGPPLPASIELNRSRCSRWETMSASLARRCGWSRQRLPACLQPPSHCPMPAADLPPQPSPRRPVPERFLASKGTLRLDRFMSWLITLGGVGVIIGVFGICFFILAEVLPLFGGATVTEMGSVKQVSIKARVLGADEWGRVPFVYEGGAEVKFVSLEAGTTKTLPLPLPPGATVTASSLDAKHNRLTLGLSDGQVGSVLIQYAPREDKADPVPQIVPETFQAVGQPGAPITDVAYGDGGASKLVAARQALPDGPHLHAVLLKEKRTLMGKLRPGIASSFDLTAQLHAQPRQILASALGDSLLVATDQGEVCCFFLNEGRLELRQRFKPFADLRDPTIQHIDYVFGDVSIVANGLGGESRVFSLYNQKAAGSTEEQRLFGETKRFPNLPRAADFFVASQRNKAIVTSAGRTVSLRYTTTESVRWERQMPFNTYQMALDGKAEHLFLLDDEGTLHRYSIDDPHPEASVRAFFGKVWYEGASEPAFVWQSTGGSDEFEPKLSLVPLLAGSLKGTFFALLFAMPVALLAAIYSACFLPAKTKRIVQPVMELMSSLPSVVLGFLGGLWLAPLVEGRVSSVLLIFLLVPGTTVLCGWLWTRAPVRLRGRVPQGAEAWMLALPALAAVLAGWHLGPWVESWAFVVKDPANGHAIADFRLWWPRVTGLAFDQRNCLVVGFVMGFAVIPVIFTIADDALSNVPASLKTGAMALGATRWQVVRTIVLPVASAGLFSAVMVGLGRAVGETMIVVMATGNTPLLDFNPFTGMRTLSANVAVELPEAAVHSTHYRALFLGALILFGLTFVLNTIAELLRQRLKDKFKTI